MKPTIAVDLAKQVFEVAISHRPGKVSKRHRLSRSRLAVFFAQQPPATVLLEACSSAHYWARLFKDYGHQVALLPPALVRSYRTRNKTDRADAKALLEAFRNEEIRPVPVKSVDQQALAALHRLRSGWVATRTARLNAVRGFLRELGVTIPLGPRFVVPRVHTLIDDPASPLPEALRPVLAQAAEEICELEARVRSVERQLRDLARQTPAVAHLRSVPGIGLLTSTALVAFVGDARRFPSGRHFASYLGLTPRERSSGSSRRLGRISKRGDRYLRMLLIHGARSLLAGAKTRSTTNVLLSWALDIERLRDTTKPPSRSPTSSPESPGKSGASRETSGRNGSPPDDGDQQQRSPPTARRATTRWHSGPNATGTEPITNLAVESRCQ